MYCSLAVTGASHFGVRFDPVDLRLYLIHIEHNFVEPWQRYQVFQGEAGWHESPCEFLPSHAALFVASKPEQSVAKVILINYRNGTL